jgi:RNA polymerase sigma-70 factor (ECF subfamily)
VTASADGEQDRQAAFEAEALPEAGHLDGLALAIIGDPGEAQDIVQETLISAWRGWASLCEPERLSAWLTRICINHSIHRRRLLHRPVLWSRERREAEQVIPAFVEGRLVDVHRAFRSLSGPQRAVVVLHHCDGYTVAECAAALECRPGTARSHLGRATTKLRRELSDA